MPHRFGGFRPRPSVEPIIDAMPMADMAREIAALPASALLTTHDAYQVFTARAPQIPCTLREIGRLREVTFRGVGEGTGNSIDLDTFDFDYIHLFLWDSSAQRVAGAYRLGPTDELLGAKGRQGLYTSTLYDYKLEWLARISPALEMGRSFVRPEYQRSFAPLLLLWKGIGTFVVKNPKYRHLFGPVSISNDYQIASRQLMVRFLRMHHALPEVAGLVKARHPFRAPLWGGPDELVDDGSATTARPGGDSDELSELVAELEPDSKGIPVLLKQYLKLGAKIAGFSVDPNFSNALDGLILVDLIKTETRVLEKYMGKDGVRSFRAHHERATKIGVAT